MIETRLIIWELIILSYVLLYPIIRVLISKRKVQKPMFYDFLFFTTLVGILHIQYLVDTGIEFLDGFTEFQFILLVAMLMYQIRTFPNASIILDSDPIPSEKPNETVLQKIEKSLSGHTIKEEEWELSPTYSFEFRNPYQLYYRVSVDLDKENKKMVFSLLSLPNRFIQILHIIGLYIATKSLQVTDANPQGSEIVFLPVFNIPVDAVFGTLIIITFSILILFLEFQYSKTLAVELPQLYKRILHAVTLEKLRGGEGVEDSDEYQSELEKARDKARHILESRKTDVLNKKREQIKSKVDNIFDKDTPPLDDETLRQIRLVKAVERILQSTPPWKTVSLKEISEKANGSEHDVELIIANLRANGEVDGIYDIWTRSYSGTKQTQWYITELLKDLTNGKSDSNLDNIKIHPDGSAEISVSKSKSQSNTKKQ
jgi:hypothetical protein